MTHRLRGHSTTSRDSRVDAPVPNSNVFPGHNPSSQQHHSNSAGGGKRKRDVLQDISEEHSGNGSSSRQQAAAGSSTRRGLAPRRPSPMAPARRASVRVRRSRRLSEQPASAAGRSGGRTTSAAGSNAGAGGAGGAGRGAGGGMGDIGGEEGSGGEGDDGSMSCDEDLEGMVVDLSFDGVADDAAWRTLPDRRQQAPAPQAAPSNGDDSAPGGGGEGRTRGSKGRIEALDSGRRDAASVANGNTNGNLNVQVQTAVAETAGRPRARGRNGDVVSRGGALTRTGPDIRARSSSQSSASTVEEQLQDFSSDGSDGCRPAAAGAGRAPETAHVSGSQLDLALAPKASSATPTGLDSKPAANTDSAGAGVAAVAERLSNERMAAAAGARTPLPAGVEDIDAGVVEAAESHLQNAEYVVEHAAFLRQQERRNRPGAYIGAKQKDMRQNMRSVLVDWIVEVCDQFKLSSRALFQVVELMDRSLTAFEVLRGKLQLLGCACVVLASKYEEIYAPTAEELAHISDNTYTRSEIINMELEVASKLEFRLTCVTPCCFIERFCRAAHSNQRERSLVCYLLELLLQDYTGVVLLPSLKAAAALYLARQTLHPKGCPREAWTKQTEYYTGYSARALEPCVRRLHALHLRAEGHSLHAVRDKFKRGQMHRVAEMTCAVEEALYFGED